MLKKIIWIIVKVLLIVVGFLGALFYFGLVISRNKDQTVQKYKTYFKLMSDWMELIEKGIYVQHYFESNGFHSIAVYGGRDAGYHLVKQLMNTEVHVACIIDKTVFSNNFRNIPIYRLNEELPAVDVVIVTPVWDYLNIKQQLLNKVNCPVISLEEIIAEVKCV